MNYIYYYSELVFLFLSLCNSFCPPWLHSLLSVAAIILFDTGWAHSLATWFRLAQEIPDRQQDRCRSVWSSSSPFSFDIRPHYLPHDICSISSTRGVGTSGVMLVLNYKPATLSSALTLLQCYGHPQAVRSSSLSCSIVRHQTIICHCGDVVTGSVS